MISIRRLPRVPDKVAPHPSRGRLHRPALQRGLLRGRHDRDLALVCPVAADDVAVGVGVDGRGRVEAEEGAVVAAGGVWRRVEGGAGGEGLENCVDCGSEKRVSNSWRLDEKARK